MIIIGEKLNSSIPGTLKIMQENNTDAIKELAVKQANAGASFLDINTAVLGEDEKTMMKKIIGIVKTETKCGIMIDSPDFSVIEECIGDTEGRNVIINSVNADSDIKAAAGLVKKYNAGIVCLPVSGGYISNDPEERLTNAERMVMNFEQEGVGRTRLYMDILVEAVATNKNAPENAIKTLQLYKTQLEGMNTICGLSNVSFGLPKRAGINAAFLAMLAAYGIDSVIIDPTSASMTKMLVTSDALLGNDEYCMNYLEFVRNGEN